MQPAERPNVVLCIAPHPDDETLGCGGTLLRHVAAGDSVHWLIVTAMPPSATYPAHRIASREREIEEVARAYGLASTHRLDLPTARLDTVPKSDLVQGIAQLVQHLRPTTLYVPYRNDAHSDHAAVFDAAVACCKSFRYPSIRRVCAYETLSETEFGLRTDDPGFRPNLFVDVADWLDRKVDIMRMFEGEMGVAPFPRSAESIRALATLRGGVAGSLAAEAFMILRQIE